MVFMKKRTNLILLLIVSSTALSLSGLAAEAEEDKTFERWAEFQQK